MFEFAVECKSPFVTIIAQQRRQWINFTEPGLARMDWETFPGTKQSLEMDQTKQIIHCNR